MTAMEKKWTPDTFESLSIRTYRHGLQLSKITRAGQASPSGSLDVTLGVHNPLLRTVLLNLYIHQNLLETL